MVVVLNLECDDMEKIKLRIEMPFKNREERHKAYLSLKPELDFQGRAKIMLEESENKVIIFIEAEDLSSLHAAVGSQLRALKVITGVQNFAEE